MDDKSKTGEVYRVTVDLYVRADSWWSASMQAMQELDGLASQPRDVGIAGYESSRYAPITLYGPSNAAPAAVEPAPVGDVESYKWRVVERGAVPDHQVFLYAGELKVAEMGGHSIAIKQGNAYLTLAAFDGRGKWDGVDPRPLRPEGFSPVPWQAKESSAGGMAAGAAMVFDAAGNTVAVLPFGSVRQRDGYAARIAREVNAYVDEAERRGGGTGSRALTREGAINRYLILSRAVRDVLAKLRDPDEYASDANVVKISECAATLQGAFETVGEPGEGR